MKVLLFLELLIISSRKKSRKSNKRLDIIDKPEEIEKPRVLFKDNVDIVKLTPTEEIDLKIDEVFNMPKNQTMIVSRTRFQSMLKRLKGGERK